VLPYIAVLLDDFEHDPSRVNEAILTAGWIDYDGANKTAWESLKETKVRPFYLCLSHLWIEGSEDNGTLYSRDPKQLWDYEAGRACKVSTFAYPLDSITSPEILKEKVVQRLLDEICREPASSESRSN
jgi:hypothetical protein